MGDLGSISSLRRSPGEGKHYPLQYSSLEKSIDCIVHGLAKTEPLSFHSVYFCHLLISSTSVRSIAFLSFIAPIFSMKYYLGVSNFLDRISSLSHSVVFLYFFALITED